MNLLELGWTDAVARHFQKHRGTGVVPGRVACVHASLFIVIAESGEYSAKVSGRFAHTAGSHAEFPAVGDWVAFEPLDGEAKGVIQAVLPRQSAILRKVAGGTTEQQVLATNVDTVFLMTAFDRDFNLRRIERYLTLAWDSGASPAILLNKADACDDPDARLAEVQAIAMGVPVHAISALTQEGLGALRPYVATGRTVALLGSSGVGKSTLVNALLGVEHMQVGAVREDDHRGRHTTAHRELIRLPDGGLLIDTPGLREIQLWASEEDVERTFEDIADLASRCRFRDCGHAHEPGCAVREAVQGGSLDPKRLESYRKLQRELRYLSRKQDQSAAAAEKAKWKRIHRELRRMTKQ